MDVPTFVDGLIVKERDEKTPEFIILKLSLKRTELLEWLDKQEGEWVNVDIKRSQKSGKLYAQVNTWVKPQSYV